MLGPGRRCGATIAAQVLLAAGAASAADGGLRFREVSAELGLDFRHHHGGSGEFYMPETMGSGVAVLDYDGDADADVLFVDSGALPLGTEAPGGTKLFRNDGGRFVDVTERSGIEASSYGMGVTAGDIDNDGDVDVYLTAFGPNLLFENLGDGSFREIAGPAGVDDDSWGASAAFADADLDGDLDLYVTNYVDFGLDNNPICGDKQKGLRSYCHPDSFDGLPDRYYRNRGDGSFEDATSEAGFGDARGAGLGVVFGDLDGDGWPDLYVANDMNSNYLFRGLGAGRFEEIALLAGAALGLGGEPEAGMGVALGDVSGDGRPEIYVTHLDRQTNALYSGTGAGLLFLDRRFVARLASPSVYKVGFGAAFGDLDLDGDLDLAVANGHIIHNVEAFGRGGSYKQSNQAFENLGGGHFVEATAIGLDAVRASRGLALGDLDGDGHLDLVISNSDDLAEVYVNESPARGAWLGVALRSSGGPGGTGALGAELELSGGGSAQSRELRSASSYMSQNQAGAHFGLGGKTRSALVVRWPNGFRQRLESVPGDTWMMVPAGVRARRQAAP